MRSMAMLVLAAATSLPSMTQELRFSNATFRLPPGWRSDEQRGLFAVMPSNLPDGQELLLVLIPSRPLSGDMRSMFNAWVQASVPPGTPVDPRQVRGMQGGGMDALSQWVAVSAGANREGWTFTGLNVNGRFESYILVSKPEHLYQRYDADIKALMASLQYRQAEPAPSGPSWEAGLPPGAPTVGAYDGVGQTGPVTPQVQSSTAAPGGAPSLPRSSPKPFRAIGRLIDSGGRPLETVEVNVTQVYREAGFTMGSYTNSATYQARGGSYDVPLPAGAIRLTAFVLSNYEGKTIRTELQPLDGSDSRLTFSAEGGVVRDFVFQVSGQRAGYQPDRFGTTAIGGALSVEGWSMLNSIRAEVTLRPIGRLLDGSPGRVIRQAGLLVFQVADIPLGKYDVSVTVAGQPVPFEIRDSDNNSYGRGPLVYQPRDAEIAGVKRMRLLVGAPY